jgi:hypothetical protein
MRLRQIALVARDLAPVARDIQTVLGLGEGYNDPGVGEFGLHNVVFPVGDTFLEIVSPEQDGTTAERLLEKRGGDGGYMVIFQTHRTKAEEQQRMKNLGVRTVWEVDLPDAKTIHLHPKDVGGAIVSLDEMHPVEHWRWAGPDWEKNTRTDITAEVIGADIQSSDPEEMAKRWAQVLGQEIVHHNGAPELKCDGSFIRFVPDSDGRGQGVAAFHIRASNKDKVLKEAKTRNLPVADSTITMAGAAFHIH